MTILMWILCGVLAAVFILFIVACFVIKDNEHEYTRAKSAGITES